MLPEYRFCFNYSTDILRVQKFIFFMIIGYKSYHCYTLSQRGAKMLFFIGFERKAEV
jgi:hypothetical protein